MFEYTGHDFLITSQEENQILALSTAMKSLNTSININSITSNDESDDNNDEGIGLTSTTNTCVTSDSDLKTRKTFERFLDKKYYSFQEIQERKRWYSATAESYRDFRPHYPDVILDDALKSVLKESHVLEVGSGPGTATISLLQRGFYVTCLEPNPEFCTLVQQDPGISSSHRMKIHNVAFEEAIIPEQSFDVVLAATSMHWIPANVAFPKAAHALKCGGTLILLWNMMMTPASPDLYRKIEDAHGEDYAALLAWGDEQTQYEVANAVGGHIQTSGWFHSFRTRKVRQTVQYTASQYLGLLSTYSFYLRLSNEERNALFERIQTVIDHELGGTISLSYISLFHAAIKKE
jgi:SAM-dependent methyltransferase